MSRSKLTPPPPKARRFKVQRYVQIEARDTSNKPFLFAETWQTVAQVDSVAAAERALAGIHRDHPNTEHRIAEEWPPGSALRVVEGQGWHKRPASYVVETAPNEGAAFERLGLRFRTKAEAQAYLAALAPLVPEHLRTRAAPSYDAPNFRWHNGRLVKV